MNTPGWLATVDEAFASRAPGVILTGNTADRVHIAGDGQVAFLRYAIARHFGSRNHRVGYFAPGTGFEDLGARTGAVGPAAPYDDVPIGASDPLLVLSSLERVLRNSDTRSVVILDYADFLFPQAGGGAAGLSQLQSQAIQVVHRWAHDDAIRHAGNFVILVSHDNALHEILRGSCGLRTVRIDLPSEAERCGFAQHLALLRSSGYRDQLGALEAGYTVDEFARATGGLRLGDIEHLFRCSTARSGYVTRDDVRQAKQHAIAQLSHDLVEVVEPHTGFEAVAGAQHAKRYFAKVRRQWYSGSAACPQAILLAGVPGCGKSHIVRAVAREFNVPLLIMRNVRDQFVGQSERNLERVLWIADNLAPCILWTDEIDQAIGQRSTGQSADGGTSERMLARLFEYFGSMSRRGKVLWIGTTNRVDILDPALLDRFQVILPWIHPTARERAQLIPALAAQIDRAIEPGLDVPQLARSSALEMLTVRSIQEIIVAAAIAADDRSGRIASTIGLRDIEQALADYKLAQDPIEHEFIALKALQMASATSLLPWIGENGAETEDLPSYVQGLVDPSTGRLDDNKLALRIAERERVRVESRWRR